MISSIEEMERAMDDLGRAIRDFGFSFPFPSARLAKKRLHWVVSKDREACGDGRWVKVSQMERWERYLPHLAPVYRWEPRR